MAHLNRKKNRRRVHFRIRKKIEGTPQRPRLAIHFSNKNNQISFNIGAEPNVIKMKEPVIIVGDIHGQFYDLVHMFEKVVDNRNLPK